MENLRAELGAAVNAGMAPALSRATESARAALGPARWEAEFASGRQLTRDAAVRLARGDSAGPAVVDDTGGVLGQREVDVARLVAEGVSNKAIGARLFISERTWKATSATS